ncbi:unnamed protein product [Gongylonema pulchrum]|uniref:INTS5_C domain-containing protein n=1 Tax=Gongylonema pulchrum TaxID=637853 RepID=A0A183CYL6_9BILA|nr:unnamed protein product [Gongylonema pulchrum]
MIYSRTKRWLESFESQREHVFTQPGQTVALHCVPLQSLFLSLQQLPTPHEPLQLVSICLRVLELPQNPNAAYLEQLLWLSSH